MLKRTLTILVTAAAMVFCCACSSVYSSQYYYTENFEDTYETVITSGTDIKNYNALKQAIIGMIENHQEVGEFQFSAYRGSVSDDLAAVCLEIRNETPMGAYAVLDLSYELRRIVSYYAAEISISYSRTSEEIDSVFNLVGLAELRGFLENAMVNCEESVTIRMYSLDVNADYILDYDEKVYFQNPLMLAFEPGVSVRSFPETGASQIYEILFDYGISSSQAFSMTKIMNDKASEIAEGISEQSDAFIALRLAEYLNSNVRAAEESLYSNGAYGAIVEGAATDKGIALAFKVLCSYFDIECMVVQGTSFDLEMSRHYWNLIKIGEDYYHIDISSFSARGREASFLLSDVQMWNYQLWDIEKYPACNGNLHYSDLIISAGEDNPEDSENSPSPDISTEPVSTPPITPSQTPETPSPSGEQEGENPDVPKPEEEI